MNDLMKDLYTKYLSRQESIQFRIQRRVVDRLWGDVSDRTGLSRPNRNTVMTFLFSAIDTRLSQTRITMCNHFEAERLIRFRGR